MAIRRVEEPGQIVIVGAPIGPAPPPIAPASMSGVSDFTTSMLSMKSAEILSTSYARFMPPKGEALAPCSPSIVTMLRFSLMPRIMKPTTAPSR